MQDGKIDASSVLDRLKTVTGTASDAQLAEALGAPKTTISSWRSRDAIPIDWLVKSAATFGVGLDELVFGVQWKSDKQEMATALALCIVEKVKPEIDVKDGWPKAWSNYLMFNELIDVMSDLIELRSKGKREKFEEAAVFIIGEIESNPSSFVDEAVLGLETTFAVRIVKKGAQ